MRRRKLTTSERSDGLIHERWSLIDGSFQNLKDPAQSLVVLGDVVQLREAIFQQYPERKLEMQLKRANFRQVKSALPARTPVPTADVSRTNASWTQETISLYDTSNYTDLPNLIHRLSHVLLFEPTSISTRVRRAICRYRVRDLSNALEDLEEALELAARGPTDDGAKEVERSVTVDALRIKALVLEEMQYVFIPLESFSLLVHKVIVCLGISDIASAGTVLERLLQLSPNDVLALSLRAKLRATSGDFEGAREDLAATNLAVQNDLAYRSRLGDGECDLEYLVSARRSLFLQGDVLSARVDNDEHEHRVEAGPILA